MGAVDAKDARAERRLRLGVRLVFYPLCIGLIAVAWSHRHRMPAARAQPASQTWVGVTDQGERVFATTVDGVLTFLRTRVVTQCSDGFTWTLRLAMTPHDLMQAGDVMSGRQGPNALTSDQDEPVVVATRVRGHMGDHPQGTIVSEVTRRPGADRIYCNSSNVTYTLRP